MVEEAALGVLFFRSNNRCYMTLITAVKTTEPTVRISIVQMTILVILENVLVCFFSRIVLPRNFIVALSLHAFSLFDKGGDYKNFPFFK